MKRIPILFAALLLASPIHAQLTLEECCRLAREHYPEIRQYDLIRKSKEYTLSNANRAYLPQIDFAAQATWQSAVPALPDALTGMLAHQGVDMPGLRKDQYRVGVDVSQSLWDGGQTRAAKRLAEAEAAEQERTTDVDLYAVEGRVKELFFGILSLDEQVRQIGLTQQLLQSNLDKLRALQREGVAMPSDGDAVEAELLAAGQRRLQAEAIAKSFRRMLGIFIGRELDDERLVCPEAEAPAPESPSRRPELALFEASAERIDIEQQRVRAASRPRFGLFIQGYYGYPGMDYFESMRSADWSWNAMAGIRMSWNFGAYYTKRNSLEKLRTSRRQIDIQRDIFLFNTRLKSTEESGEIVRLRRALADDDRIVALRRAVREAAEAKLRNGVIDTNGLLQTITDEAAASLNRSAREIELTKAIYDLKHTLNR